jgi:hypothetical protein
MAAKITPLTQKTATIGHLETEIYTACLSRSHLRVQEFLGTPSVEGVCVSVCVWRNHC